MWNRKFATDVRKSNLEQASVLQAHARLGIYFIPDQGIEFVQQFNCLFSFPLKARHAALNYIAAIRGERATRMCNVLVTSWNGHFH